MDRQQILDAIYAAFPERPIPTSEVFAEHVRPNDCVKTQEFLNELAGKSWRNLTPEFRVQWRYYFGLLQPESYAYYLPALLTGSLSLELDDRDPIQSTVFAISPSFGAVNLDGHDTSLRARQAAFTEAQYRAVCDFLEVAFDEGDRFARFQAAQGLRWGWNQLDTPALEAANAFLHGLRNFSYPESKDSHIAELCREIRSAFAATPYPGDDALCEGGGEEPGEIAMGLRGVPWQSAHPHLLDCCSSALSFLSDAGFRYFLPTFLLADLLHKELDEKWDYYGNAQPVFSLTRGLYDKRIDVEGLAELSAFTSALGSDKLAEFGLSLQRTQEMFEAVAKNREEFDWYGYSLSRLRLFAPQERMAIIHYLEFQAEDTDQAVEINQALENYWRPSLHSSETPTGI